MSITNRLIQVLTKAPLLLFLILIFTFLPQIQASSIDCEGWKDNLGEHFNISYDFALQYPNTTGWETRRIPIDVSIRTTETASCSLELYFSLIGQAPFDNPKVLTNIDLKESISFDSQTLVDPVNVSKYVIDGEPMSSYTIKDIEGSLREFTERGLTIHDGQVYRFIFTTYTRSFNNFNPDPQALEIKNFILNSIRWLR